MSWEKFDLFDVEETQFSVMYYEVVMPLFGDFAERTERLAQKIDAEYERAASTAGTKTAEIDAHGWAAYRETQLDEQKDVVSAAVLNALCGALKSGLNSMGRYFDESNPPKLQYQGKSWLHRKEAEFSARFGIDFRRAPIEFAAIEELFLARNAAIHDDEVALGEYAKAVQHPKFLSNGLLVVERESLDACFHEADTFLRWVWTALKKIRTERTQKVRA